jgi:hypothetical protein
LQKLINERLLDDNVRWFSRETVTSVLTVEEALRTKVNDGCFRHDSSHLRTAKRLSRLQLGLRGYDNGPLLRRKIEMKLLLYETVMAASEDNDK